MPLLIVKQDITTMKTDAIVDPSNTRLIPGGGADLAIHTAAGAHLGKAAAALGGCGIAQAKTAKGYDLPAKYVIFTVGPVWQDGCHGESETLARCYINCLREAEKHGCQSIAFPLISSGSYGFPEDKALKTATEAITGFIRDNDMTVYIVLYDRREACSDARRAAALDDYLGRHRREAPYAAARREEPLYSMSGLSQPLHTDRSRKKKAAAPRLHDTPDEAAAENVSDEEAVGMASAPWLSVLPSESLEEMLRKKDESFSQMLLRKIDEKGIKDSECYKKANIDRKLFSKIRSNVHYKPKKSTALAFAIALELDIEETKELLMKAGFALTHAEIADIIVEYYIINGIYDIFEINEALFRYDQMLLGS